MEGDCYKLCAMTPRLRLKKYPLSAGIEPGTTISAGERSTYSATGARGEGNVEAGKLSLMEPRHIP